MGAEDEDEEEVVTCPCEGEGEIGIEVAGGVLASEVSSAIDTAA